MYVVGEGRSYFPAEQLLQDKKEGQDEAFF